MGYDDESAEWIEEQSRYADVVRDGAVDRALEEEHMSRLRRPLESKLRRMRSKGQAFSHDFQAHRLGFNVGLVQYGEGRSMVEVTATRPECDLYPDALKPRDELVAIDEKIVVCKDAKDFEDVLHDLRTLPRPINLTFFEGQGRDDAFEAQELQRDIDMYIVEDDDDPSELTAIDSDHDDPAAYEHVFRPFNLFDFTCGACSL